MTDRKAEGGAMVKQGKAAKQLRRARRKIKWLQKELAKALLPESKLSPLEIKDFLVVPWAEFNCLVGLATQAPGAGIYPYQIQAAVLDAQDAMKTLSNNLDPNTVDLGSQLGSIIASRFD